MVPGVHTDWPRDGTTSAGFFHRGGLLLAIPMRGTGDSDLWRLMADVPALDRRLDEADIIARLEQLLPERAGETGVHIRDAIWTSE